MGNGMKSGSGEDPFEGIESSGDQDEETADDASAAADAPADGDTEPMDEDVDVSGNSASTGLPWKYSRSNAKDGREMVQFFLQQETQSMEDHAQADLQDILNDDVLVLDMREAAYRVALEQHLGDVAEQLREWGYDAE